MSRVRFAESRDIPTVMRLLAQVNLLHHKGRPDLFKATAKYAESELQAMFANPETPVFVYDDGAGNVLGYAICFLKRSGGVLLNDVQTLYIDDLCVDETRRGQGIGRALYERAVAFARDADCYNVTLNVWTLNPSAMRFYENLGMKPQRITMEHIVSADS